MSLNAKTIEILSVNAVKDSIAMCDFLEPFINDNDKEPSWDGDVYIYNNRTHKKENLAGRLSVQVKGKAHEGAFKSEISYSISTIDLRNFLYDGGIILFVVYIDNGGLRKIYYVELPPIKLRVALAETQNKKTKSLTLKEFPTDNNKKATIFLNCLQNCHKQASFTDTNLFSLEDLQKSGVLTGITVPLSVVGEKDPHRALVTNEVYIYANIKGSSIPQPLEYIPYHLAINQQHDLVITIEEKVYYTKIQEINTEKSTTYKIGESFTISSAVGSTSYKIDYKNSTKIRVLAKDLGFMLSYIEFGYFRVNDTKFPFDKNGADFSHFNIEEQKLRFLFAQKAVKALDMLNCKEDVDLNKLSAEDGRNLERLITAFVDKKPVENLKPNLPPIAELKVGTLSFALCFQRCENAQTTYNIYDFFKTEMSVTYEGTDGEKLPTSQYSILHSDDFLTINNIRFDVFLPSFQAVKKHYDSYNRANWFLLDLLTAFDNSDGKRVEILKAAHEFADWILKEADEDQLPYQVKKLNYLQVIKRKREFNISELAELYALIEDSTTKEDILVGAYLLLGQQRAAEIHFSRLTPELQNSFKSYPIYRFWNENR